MYEITSSRLRRLFLYRDRGSTSLVSLVVVALGSDTAVALESDTVVVAERPSIPHTHQRRRTQGRSQAGPARLALVGDEG